MYFAVTVDGDDRDSGGKAAHRLAKFYLRNAHGKSDSPPVLALNAERPASRSRPSSFTTLGVPVTALDEQHSPVKAGLMYDFVIVGVGQPTWTDRQPFSSYVRSE